MLPFPIMNHYGNILPAKETLKDFGAGSGYLGVLGNHGNLYISGPSATSYFGTSTTQMSLLSTGVDEAWFGTTMDCILIRSGNEYYQNGFAPVNVAAKKWISYTDKFEQLFTLAGTRVIKKIMVEPYIVVQMENNKLYGFGLTNNGVFGNGSMTSTLSSFTLIAQDVKDFVCAYTGLVFITNTGKLYCAGTDNNGSMLGTNRASFYEIPNYFSTSNYSSLYIVGTSLSNILAYNTVDNNWYGTGRNIYGLGGTFAQNTSLSKFTLSASNITRSAISDAVGNTNLVVSDTDGKLYICGINSYGMTGLGTTDSVTMSFTVLPETAPVIKVRASTSCSYYMTANKELYGAGNGNTYLLPPSTGQFSRFKKLTLPF